MLPLLADVITSLATGQRVQLWVEPAIVIGNCVWVASPFVLLLLWSLVTPAIDNGYRVASLIGITIASTAWTWFAYDGYHYQMTNQGGGANIGLGLLLLMLPFVLAVLMPFICWFLRPKQD